jgi:hypothetical protein
MSADSAPGFLAGGIAHAKTRGDKFNAPCKTLPEEKEDKAMTQGMIKWTTVMVIGLSLFTAGCGEKEGDSDTSQSRVGVAPSSAPEKSGPDNTLAPSGGSEQSPPDTK